MTRYLSDQNAVAMIAESGLYANTSGIGIWIGQVQENSIDDVENKFETRSLGAYTRGFTTMDAGPRDVTGTLTYFPQDMRLPFISIGSITDVSGTNSIHAVSEINTNVRQSAYTSGTLNPPFSFTIEDAKVGLATGSNFVRTVIGCVPNQVTITAAQNEKVSIEAEYIGQTLTYSSGAPVSLTPLIVRPYLYADCSLTLSGTVVQTAKNVELVINQNTTGPHYLNGSRDIAVPYQGNRAYTLNVTLDWEATQAKNLYSNLFKSNAAFNSILDVNADSSTGSQHATFYLSGCRITAADIPSPLEGTNEVTLEIRPQSVVGSSYDSVAQNARYNPW